MGYVQTKFPESKSASDCTQAIVDALVAGGIAAADRKQVTFAMRPILSQHFQQWSLLLANIDASLKPMSVIKTKVLKDAAPQLIALDRQQAQNDLEAVESSLTKENLQLLLVEQLKLTGVSVAVSAIEKEKYSPLFRSLALLVALDDLLSGKPDAAAHQKIAKTLFPEPGAAQKELVDTIPTQAWSDLKEAYRWPRRSSRCARCWRKRSRPCPRSPSHSNCRSSSSWTPGTANA